MGTEITTFEQALKYIDDNRKLIADQYVIRRLQAVVLFQAYRRINREYDELSDLLEQQILIASVNAFIRFVGGHE